MNVGTIKSNDPCWCGSGKKFKRCHKDGGGPNTVPTPSVVKGRVSPVRPVPAGIIRPDYVDNNGRPRRNNAAPVQTPEAIEKMRRACQAAVQVVEKVRPHVQVGITTDELDQITHNAYIELGGYPSCVGYGGFLKSVCTSVNEVICHGIPDDRPLADGDILNVDVTIFLDGFHGDYSVMFGVGNVDESSRQLIEVTKQCLDLGVAAVRPGAPINDIGRAIETHAKKFGYGVVHAFVGHGIGEVFHMAPNVPHYYDRNARTIMVPGMTFTIEPMITLSGRYDYDLWDDGWTAVTSDLSRTAQWEHTVLVTETGVEVLTQLPDRAGL